MTMLDTIAKRFGYARPVKRQRRIPPVQEIESKSWETALRQAWLHGTDLTAPKVLKPYAQHLWVYRCLKIIGSKIGQVPFKFMRGENEVIDQWYVDLFRDVSPLLNRFDLFAQTVIYLGLHGECFWILEKKGSARVQELYILPGIHFDPITGKDGIPIGWKYHTPQGQMREFKAEEVIQFKQFNPYNSLRGLSTISAARMSIDADWMAKRWNIASLQQSMSATSVISHEKLIPKDARERLEEILKDKNAGYERAGKTLFLDGGLKYEALTLSAHDMEYIESQRMSREELLGVFGVPPALAGIFEQSKSYANTKEQRKIFWSDTLIPQLRYFEEVLATEFMGRFKLAGVEGRFDLSEVEELREDYKDVIALAQQMTGIGIPLNAVIDRLELGVEKVPWGNVAWMPFNLQPVSSGEATEIVLPTASEEAPAKSADPIKNLAALLKQKSRADHEYAAHWKAFVTPIIPIEQAYAAKVKKHFYTERSKILAEIAKNGKALAKQDEETEAILKRLKKIIEAGKPILVSLSEPYYDEALKVGAENLVQQIGGSFSVDHPLVRDYIRDKLSKIEDVQNTSWQKLQAAVTESYRAGEGTEQLAERIREMYGFAEGRSQTIARTEMVGAANGGRFFAALESDLEDWEWLTAPGADHPRHEEYPGLDGQKVKVGEMFTVGNSQMQYPGDPNGPAEEVIQCRCTTLPVIQK